jgi:hypothetical protein
MLPISPSASGMAAAIDDDTTIPASRDLARPPTSRAAPLAGELARTRQTLLESMAREHLALCPMIKSFPDQEPSFHGLEADCRDYLVSCANARLASPPTADPARPNSFGWSTEQDMQADLFVRRAAPRLTEAALCRALARQLLARIGAAGPGDVPADPELLHLRTAGLKRTLGFAVPTGCVLARDAATGEVRAHGDASLLGRALWRERRSTAGAPEDERVAVELPGSPARQLRIEGGEWVSIVGPGGTEAPVRVADLALIDQTEGCRSRLTAPSHEQVALTVVESSEIGELMDFPAAWICSGAVASALLDRLDDDAMSTWMARQLPTTQPDIARRVAASCVHAWRHGLVAGNADRLGKAVALESLRSTPRPWLDERRLAWACVLGDAERVQAILGGVLGGIGKGLTAEEALAILWRDKDLSPLAARHGHRCADAFLDALAPALLDGRLSPAQATRLLGGGCVERGGLGLTSVFSDGFCGEARRFLDRLRRLQGPTGLSRDQLGQIIAGTVGGKPGPDSPFSLRTVMKRSPTDIADWYAEILALWREQGLHAQDATRLMLGLNQRGWTAWHGAFRRDPRAPDPAVILALVEAWVHAIQARLLPPDSLRDGLLSQSPHTEQRELARAAGSAGTPWLPDLFARLGELTHQGVLPVADLCELLDATLDTQGLPQATTEEYPRLDAAVQAAFQRMAAQRQLALFHRLLNQCLREGSIDAPAAARLLLARRDGRPSRSVLAAAFAGGDAEAHSELLREALHRGTLSPEERAQALALAAQLAELIDGRAGRSNRQPGPR